MRHFHHGLARTLLCGLVLLLSQANNVSAELLPADKLQSCQLHVVGIYSPKDHNTDDRVYVEVLPTDAPMVLVLSGYFGAQWNVKIAPEADVRQIIVAGYFEHSIVGVPDTVPVEMVTYFPAADKSKRDYFWAYALHTQYGRELRSRLKELTGLDIATFQGEYSGDRFIVDGKIGRISEQATTKVPKTRSAKQKSTAEQRLRELGLAAKTKLTQLTEQFGSNHPSVKQVQKSIEMVESELDRMGASPIGTAKQKPPTTQGEQQTDQRKLIEDLVRQAFEYQTELQMERVERAEADLRRVKEQLARRRELADKIIAARVEELLASDSAPPTNDAIEQASLLANEGWKAWRERDLRTALDKFRDAVELEPENGIALNGLGWTYTNLGKLEDGMEIFKKILEQSPTHAAAQNGLGQCLLGLGRLDEAERELLKATEDSIAELGEAGTVKMGLAAWFGLVRTYLEKGDPAQAKIWIDRYLKHKPDDETMKQMLQQAEDQKASSN